MTRRPLFSTYSQGENRVTGSLLAVFERLDVATLQAILSEAADDPALELLVFRLQPAQAAGTVPDAEITAGFRYLFEVKTAFDAVSTLQLKGHLAHFSGSQGIDERLFVVTPDSVVPAAVSAVQDAEGRVTWFNFSRLNAAIESAVQLEAIRDDERLLLRELQVLLDEEGLLGRQDTVVVAARLAHAFYLTHAAYVCQQGRTFRPGLTHLGFYRKGHIERELPCILHVEDSVEFTSAEAARRRSSTRPVDLEIGELVEATLSRGERKEGDIHKVFLLSECGDPQTVMLSAPLPHQANGVGSAFTMGQRYVYLADLQTATSTADLR